VLAAPAEVGLAEGEPRFRPINDELFEIYVYMIRTSYGEIRRQIVRYVS